MHTLCHRKQNIEKRKPCVMPTVRFDCVNPFIWCSEKKKPPVRSPSPAEVLQNAGGESIMTAGKSHTTPQKAPYQAWYYHLCAEEELLQTLWSCFAVRPAEPPRRGSSSWRSNGSPSQGGKRPPIGMVATQRRPWTRTNCYMLVRSISPWL